MSLVAGQPFPDLPAWEDLSGILSNEWNTGIAGLSLRGYVEGNTVHISGRVHIGAARIAGVLPSHLIPGESQGLTALIMKGPSCIVEIWPGGQLVMSNFSLGLTEAQMIDAYKGQQLFFSGNFPRGAQ